MKTTFCHEDYLTISTPVNSEDFKLFSKIVNIGIDSRLEGFIVSKFFYDCGRFYFHFHNTEKHILINRLEELISKATDETIIERLEDWKENIVTYEYLTD